jgi:hypothetical protein
MQDDIQDESMPAPSNLTAHDIWFQAGVEAALASTAATVSNEDVRNHFAKKRASLRAGIAAE